jgi:hypothetical protein
VSVVQQFFPSLYFEFEFLYTIQVINEYELSVLKVSVFYTKVETGSSIFLKISQDFHESWYEHHTTRVS